MEAVRRGRTAEFARFAWQDEVPDPGAPATFVRSRLNHALATAPRHRELREYYRRWLATRRSHPALGARDKQRTRASLDADGAVLTVARAAASGERVELYANLTAEPRPFSPPPSGRVLIDSAHREFGGPGDGAPLGPFQALLVEPPDPRAA